MFIINSHSIGNLSHCHPCTFKQNLGCLNFQINEIIIRCYAVYLLKYSDNIIDIYETYSNDTDYSLWEIEEFRSLHIRITIDSSGQVTDYYSCSSVDTLRMAEYFNKIGGKSNGKQKRINNVNLKYTNYGY